MSEKITLQMIFDKAWQAFAVEKRNPAFVNGRCWYLTPDGNRCAIGLALPDAAAVELRFLEISFGQLTRHHDFFELFDTSLLELSVDDLNHFQAMLHDDLVDAVTDGWNRPVEHLRYQYIEVARRYNLTIPKTTGTNMKSLHEIEDELDYQDQQKPNNNFEFLAITVVVLVLGLLMSSVLVFILR